MTLLHQSEKDDYISLINQLGYSESEFELIESENIRTEAKIYTITGTVTVRRKGIERQYAAGHGTTWLTDFETDLRNHIFGAP